MERSWALFLILVTAAGAQTLTPREVFYGQGRQTVKRAAATTPPRVTKSTPQDPRTPPDPDPVGIKPVANTVRPLGLKYMILKRGEAGEYTQTDPDSTFVSGDRIRLTIETNDSGYLYVVAQGTSLVWKVLYPSAEVAGGSNRVARGQQYNIPTDAVFSFDTHAGTEKLFIVLSRQPEQDLENLIYTLDKRQRDHAEPAQAVLAQNIGPVQDSLVERLRTTYARDLVIEKVDDTKTPPPARTPTPVKTGADAIPTQEKAVYVVNTNAGENARVVADIELRHE